MANEYGISKVALRKDGAIWIVDLHLEPTPTCTPKADRMLGYSTHRTKADAIRHMEAVTGMTLDIGRGVTEGILR